ncbi:ATP-binding protein [Streptomyces sp. NPDC057555]|uniref:ATP-binding protein n=1 Tax=Streptomyces sp. NPDC057555 TaxID=3346166 RepID=UPI00369B6F8E
MAPLHRERNTVRVVWRWTEDTPDAVSRARTALECALDQLGFGGEVREDAVLAVSELVANALEHAPGPYEMRLRRVTAGMVCEVVDRDPRIPRVPAMSARMPFAPVPELRGGGLDALLEVMSERGRGLHIVHQLTHGRWGFMACTREEMKVAWMLILSGDVKGQGRA